MPPKLKNDHHPPKFDHLLYPSSIPPYLKLLLKFELPVVQICLPLLPGHHPCINPSHSVYTHLKFGPLSSQISSCFLLSCIAYSKFCLLPPSDWPFHNDYSTNVHPLIPLALTYVPNSPPTQSHCLSSHPIVSF